MNVAERFWSFLNEFGGYSPLGFACQTGLSMNEVTRILDAIGQGEAGAAAQLLPLVYDELRRLAAERMAQEKSGQTLQPTALVHEAYLRLVGHGEERHWDSRGHFFAAAAEAMRRILIDNARRKLSGKHGGGLVTGRRTRMTSPWQTLATRSKSWRFTKPWIGWHRSRPARLSW